MSSLWRVIEVAAFCKLFVAEGASSTYRSPQAPHELCGVYEAASCSEPTANMTITFNMVQSFLPNSTFLEEGSLATGMCNVDDSSAGIAAYSIRGTYRDHGEEHRQKGMRKMVLDFAEIWIRLLPPPDGNVPLRRVKWKRMCPCGGHGWDVDKPAIDVRKVCPGDCPAFAGVSNFELYNVLENQNKVCVSPRRSFDERWPMRQETTLCLSKQAGMNCLWETPAPVRAGGAFTAVVPSGAFKFQPSHYTLPLSNLAEVEIGVSSVLMTLAGEGDLFEVVDWRMGGNQGPHFRSIVTGRLHDVGAHLFAPGVTQLRLELTQVALTPTGTDVCLEGEKGDCTKPRVAMRLLCPCAGAWSGGGPTDILQCPEGSCAFASLFARESFFLGAGARSTSGESLFCMSARHTQRFKGWHFNATSALRCSGSGEPNLEPPTEGTAAVAGASAGVRDTSRGSARSAGSASASARHTAAPEQETRSSKEDIVDTASRRPWRTTTTTTEAKEAEVVGRVREMPSYSSRQQRRPAAARVPSGPGVKFFAEAGYEGESLEAGEGQHSLKSLGFSKVRSAKVPSGWRLTILAPLQGRHHSFHLEPYPIIKNLVFDVHNISGRLDKARPWLDEEELAELEGNLTFGVAAYDGTGVPGVWLSSNLCSEAREKEAQFLSPFEETSERFEIASVASGGPKWRSIRVDEGYRAVVDPHPRKKPTAELVGKIGACVDLSKQPDTVEVNPSCAGLNDCSGHGFCRRPGECLCRLTDGYAGKKCHLRIPDQSSSIVCDSVVAFIGHELLCRIHARREYSPVAADPEVVTVKFRKKMEGLGSIIPEDFTENSTTASFRFRPARAWAKPVPLFELTSPHTLLSDIGNSFTTPMHTVSTPSGQLECGREDLSTGAIPCQIRMADWGGTPVPVPPRLVEVSCSGGVATLPVCESPGQHALCANYAFQVEALTKEIMVKVKLSITSAKKPIWAAEQKIQSTAAPQVTLPPSAFNALGVPYSLGLRLWSKGLGTAVRRDCMAPATSGGRFSPAVAIEAAEEAAVARDHRTAIGAGAAASRLAGACAAFGVPASVSLLEARLRSMGISAMLDWRVYGQVDEARQVAAACATSSRGDKDAERWAAQCRTVISEISGVEAAVAKVGDLREAVRWADIPPVVGQGLKKLWEPERLDSEGARPGLNWFFQLRMASCEAWMNIVVAKSLEKHTPDGMNATASEALVECQNATAAVNLVQAFWKQAIAWDIEGNTWRIRIQIYKAEILLAAGKTGDAMTEIMKAMSMEGGEKGDDHDLLWEVFRKIMKAKSSKGGSSSFSDMDEEDKKDDPYEIMGIPRNATDAEVKRAYRQLALKYHPDKAVDKEEAQKAFIKITEAYEYILADTSRQTADERAAAEARRKGRSSTPKDKDEDDDEEDDEDEVGNATNATDDEEKKAKKKKKKEKKQKKKERERRAERASYDDWGDSGRSRDPFEGVEMPKHCCLPCLDCPEPEDN